MAHLSYEKKVKSNFDLVLNDCFVLLYSPSNNVYYVKPAKLFFNDVESIKKAIDYMWTISLSHNTSHLMCFVISVNTSKIVCARATELNKSRQSQKTAYAESFVSELAFNTLHAGQTPSPSICGDSIVNSQNINIAKSCHENTNLPSKILFSSHPKKPSSEKNKSTKEGSSSQTFRQFLINSLVSIKEEINQLKTAVNIVLEKHDNASTKVFTNAFLNPRAKGAEILSKNRLNKSWIKNVSQEMVKIADRGLTRYETDKITEMLVRGTKSPRSLARSIARIVFKDLVFTHFLPDRRPTTTSPKKTSDRQVFPAEKETLFTDIMCLIDDIYKNPYAWEDLVRESVNQIGRESKYKSSDKSAEVDDNFESDDENYNYCDSIKNTLNHDVSQHDNAGNLD